MECLYVFSDSDSTTDQQAPTYSQLLPAQPPTATVTVVTSSGATANGTIVGGIDNTTQVTRNKISTFEI